MRSLRRQTRPLAPNTLVAPPAQQQQQPACTVGWIATPWLRGIQPPIDINELSNSAAAGSARSAAACSRPAISPPRGITTLRVAYLPLRSNEHLDHALSRGEIGRQSMLQILNSNLKDSGSGPPSLLRGIAMLLFLITLRLFQPNSLYRHSGRCHHCRATVRATAVLRRGLIYLLNRLALRCWRLFATFSTSNRRHAASYQGMACKSHHDAKTWSHIYL